MLYFGRIAFAGLVAAAVSSYGVGVACRLWLPGSGHQTMLGRISAPFVRQKIGETPEDEGAPNVKRLVVRFWRRTPRSPIQPPEVDTVTEEATPNRFEPVRLSQVETPGRWPLVVGRGSKADDTATRIRFSRPGQAAEKPEVEKKRLALPGAGRVFDRALLALEVVGALVIAWLAFQYIYTVYIDTGSHRLSGSGGNTVIVPQGGRATSTPTPALSPTPTRFAETLPPLTGEGPGGGGAIGRATAILLPTPTATIEPQLLLPTRLRIPVMFLDSPVHEVTINLGNWEVSPMDIGHHEGTGNPGQTGNVVLAGHRDINSALFRELDRVKPGDEVFVSNSLGEYRYVVQEIFEVSPDQVWVMDPTADKRVTLITCTPIGLATRRLVVVALLDER